MNGPYHLYHATTGLFVGQTFDTNLYDAKAAADFARSNTPAGHAVYEGNVADHGSQRVDITTGKLINYQPPQPSADDEWNADLKRWVVKADVLAKQQASAAALAQINALESKGIRAMRELALGMAGAHDRLASIEVEIAALRTALS
jgi:hypothetical protein